MSAQTPGSGAGPGSRRARSFDRVAEAYERARPGYPEEAARWLLAEAGERPLHVLELGAGTGKLTAGLIALGHRVTALDPAGGMLAQLRTGLPPARPVVAVAEALPLADASVDAVVAAQAYHWFDHARAIPEITRVLRPGGTLGLVWNDTDRRIPWVRRLESLLGGPHEMPDPTAELDDTGLFEVVEARRFRFWQPMGRDGLRDLAQSRSAVATLGEEERTRTLEEVDALYDSYGRGPDGMLLPYDTFAYRTKVLPFARHQRTGPQQTDPSPPRRTDPEPQDGTDPDSLLIDFR